MSPEVTVIIPHYNRASLLAETINSVKKQTYNSWEIIVVDDGSDSEELELLEKYKDYNIHLYYRDSYPKGSSHCRNIGIKKAKGQFILFLDSDDLLAPWSIETRVKSFADHKNFD